MERPIKSALNLNFIFMCDHLKHYTHQTGILIGGAECQGQDIEETPDGKYFTETARVFIPKEILIEEANAERAKIAELEAQKSTAQASIQAEIDKRQAHVSAINDFE